ncbi:ExbD/TolR family protein [Puniceicoccus vermicola]|uniref:Biopolymer transporter ExbD n=1 Tax=Puniceicoccus vermicola TaxID=388746 RepID=A0A7X1B223_9BACT|nr:biopolymer transporter ExbD [Puniceicoccus vermicola]MBC2604082.1 biopolymer transporter ExbD [Puniceicoccus vermicola]
MARLKKKAQPKPEIQIAPMIDCVFLLLIYFMVSATLEKQEADLSFELPGTVEQSEPVEMPDEQIIEIRADGQVIVNEFAYDSPDSPRFQELAAMLTRFKEASSANQVDAIVTISPADLALHQSIIKVMDAISIAGIDSVNFSLSESSGV